MPAALSWNRDRKLQSIHLFQRVWVLQPEHPRINSPIRITSSRNELTVDSHYWCGTCIKYGKRFAKFQRIRTPILTYFVAVNLRVFDTLESEAQSITATLKSLA